MVIVSLNKGQKNGLLQAFGGLVHFLLNYRFALEDIAEKREGLKVLMRHFDGPVEPMPDAMVARTAVIKIEITEMTGKNSGYPRPE